MVAVILALWKVKEGLYKFEASLATIEDPTCEKANQKNKIHTIQMLLCSWPIPVSNYAKPPSIVE